MVRVDFSKCMVEFFKVYGFWKYMNSGNIIKIRVVPPFATSFFWLCPVGSRHSPQSIRISNHNTLKA